MRRTLYSLVFLFNCIFVEAQKVIPPEFYGPLPSERQLDWHETGFYGIIHFTPTTFENKEWGYGDADPAIFNPSSFDAGQIVAAAKLAGMKGVVFVCKHHDGFCLWPTKTTDYNISRSPWKDGKGDMVREMKDACDKAGLKFGIYISPWDRNNTAYGTAEYVEVYREQLREIYTNYGELFMSWHDGANGGDGYYGGAREKRYIDRATYYGWDTTWFITREMQPGACIFSDMGPDVRWVGNESGIAGDTCWAAFTPKGADDESKPAIGNSRYWESVNGHRDGKYWIPAECDVPLRPGWFYHPEQDSLVKTPEELFDLYCKSVGRGQCLDLGLCPDSRGQIHESDVASLKGLGELLEKTFSYDLAIRGEITISNIRGNDKESYGAHNLLDNDRYSYWATDDTITSPELILEFDKSQVFSIITIRENIKLGQRIDEFAIDTWKQDAWHEVTRASSIGALRIVRFPEAETSSKIRLRIIQSSAPPCISELGVYTIY